MTPGKFILTYMPILTSSTSGTGQSALMFHDSVTLITPCLIVLSMHHVLVYSTSSMA